MEFWLLVVIGILLIIIFSLVIKLFFVHKTVREIEAQFTERLMTETNTLIDIYSAEVHATTYTGYLFHFYPISGEREERCTVSKILQ